MKVFEQCVYILRTKSVFSLKCWIGTRRRGWKERTKVFIFVNYKTLSTRFKLGKEFFKTKNTKFMIAVQSVTKDTKTIFGKH